jgi:succinoglycan biosynthesis protein ExoM
MKVLVGIPTYRRPRMLARALESAMRLDPPAGEGGEPVEVEIVVVDNDPECSARGVVEEIAAASSLPVRYATCERRGLSSVRNALIAQTLSASADFAAWFDDDEIARPDWLRELVSVQRRFQADVVAGPVNPLLPPDMPGWTRRLFRYKPKPTGSGLRSVATSNVLFSARLVRDWGLRFDEAFNLSGGEDVAFFAEAAGRGAVMVWAAEAWVDEHVHPQRLTRRAVYLRHYGTAAAHAHASRQRLGTARAAGRLVPKSLDRLLAAALFGPLLLVAPDRATAKFLGHAGTGLGSLAGLFGFGHERYRRTQGH